MAAADVRLRRVLLGNSFLTDDDDYNETQALILSPAPPPPRLTLRRPAHDFPGEGVAFLSLLLFHHHRRYHLPPPPFPLNPPPSPLPPFDGPEEDCCGKVRRVVVWLSSSKSYK